MVERSNGLRFDWFGVTFFVCACVLGGLAGYFGQPLVDRSERAVTVLVTMFSVLAGFLVAIITLIGDPTIFTGRTWRVQEIAMGKIKRSLERQRWLFYIYLATVGTVFLSTLIPPEHKCVIQWTERTYLAFAVVGFLMSFLLPGTLMKVQMQRHEAMIEAKRKPAPDK